jgi:hypothetical protein
MKRYMSAFATSALLMGAIVSAQSAAPPRNDPQKSDEPQKVVELTGCLVQGSGPNVFVLDKARKNDGDKDERAISYLVTADAKDLNLRQHLNHKVRLSGSIEKQPSTISGGDDTPPANRQLNEKDLSKFKSKTVTVVSDRCEADREN